MRVLALDHVNVISDDMIASERFYTEILGLEARNGPAPFPPEQIRWMYDEAGRPVIHLNHPTAPRRFDRSVEAGATGAIHHVAFGCEGYAAMVARLEAHGTGFETSHVESMGLRQIFTLDPNGVLFELNFFGD